MNEMKIFTAERVGGAICGLLNRYKRLVVFDTETSGLIPYCEKIIEFGAVALTLLPTGEVEKTSTDMYIQLDRPLTPTIVNLTGITDEKLSQGLPREEAERALCDCLFKGGLVCGYNLQFDLSFVYRILSALDRAGDCKSVRFLDLMTVYKDRAPYPHKLKNAVEHYGVIYSGAHNAYADARMTAAVLAAMLAEKEDLSHYENLFGYNPKYGINGVKIPDITYKPQPYDSTTPLYLK